MKLNLALPSFNQNFLFLDKSAFRNKHMQITLDGRLTGQTGTFFQFILIEKL
jgi:hypothetical protein